MLLKFALQDFNNDREFKNLSKNTLTSYNFTLKEFHEFCVKNDIICVDDVRPTVVKTYLMMCQKEKGNNPTTINSKLHHLKIFFNYLQDEEIIATDKQNPTKKIGYIKEDIKIEVFTNYHIKQMLNHYKRIKKREKSFFAYRDYCMIIVFLGTGFRLGEVINLRWKDINWENNTITVFGKKRIQSSIPITDKLKNELAEYKIFVRQMFEKPCEYVFALKDNKQMTTGAVKCVFKRLKDRMNFTDVRLSPHTFRHTFAQRCLSAGMDVFTLQKMLRHTDLKMTQKYLALWGTALHEVNDKFNPLNDIDI